MSDNELPEEEEEFIQEMRSEDEIQIAIEEFFNRVWYNRKFNLFYNIEKGIESEPSPKQMGVILKEMEKVEKEYGKDNLGPYSDFEWGMINGKLSALRWVLGDDWDFLDT